MSTSGFNFIPNDIPLLGAFDANNPNNSSVEPSNNSLITTWNTITGTAENPTQANTAAQPTFLKNQCGQHSIIRFSGAQSLTAAATKAYAANTPLTVVMLAKITGMPAGVQVALSRSTASGGWRFGQYNNGSIPGAGYNAFVNKVSYFTATQMHALNAFQVSTAVFNGATTTRFRVNRVPFATVTVGASGSVIANAGITIGSALGSMAYFTGDIQYIFYYPGVLPDDVLFLLENFLYARIPT